MPLTNADYLANPAPPSFDPVARFTSLGASRERAERLAKFVRTQRIAARIRKPAALIGVALAVWIVYALWLALNGSPATPSFEQMLIPSMSALVVGIVMAITRAISLTTGPFWEASASIPRELASVPRRAIVRPVAIGGVMAGVAFAVALSIGGLLVRDVRDAALLQREGAETTGTVISRTIRPGKDKRYTVTYRYTVGGVVMQNSASVRRSQYQEMTEGSNVRVTYAATNPIVSKPFSRAHLGGTTRAFVPLLAIAGGLVGLVALMTLLMAWAARQTAALATRGVAVLARMDKVDHFGAHYSYRTDQGVIDSKVSFGKQRPAPMPVEGESYLVLFDPDNPRRSLPIATLQDVRFV
ncbi:MAG TPA: DUF3592 domain-containing protein [Thermoanaerobaculia bacterium]|nr:DUF3592 domain-containing protein [Thermoanaerobaculia bacterium]